MIYYNTADFDNIKCTDSNKTGQRSKSGFRVLLVLFAALLIISAVEISSYSQQAQADNESRQDTGGQTVDSGSPLERPGSLRH